MPLTFGQLKSYSLALLVRYFILLYILVTSEPVLSSSYPNSGYSAYALISIWGWFQQGKKDQLWGQVRSAAGHVLHHAPRGSHVIDFRKSYIFSVPAVVALFYQHDGNVSSDQGISLLCFQELLLMLPHVRRAPETCFR